MTIVDPIIVPSISPGTYVRLCRQGCGLTCEQVALMLETDPSVSTRRRVEWLETIESGAEDISLRTALVLQDVIALDLRILAYWMATAEGATPSHDALDVAVATGATA